MCKILGADGELASVAEIEALAEAHSLKIVSVADLIAHRMRTEKLVRQLSHVHLPTPYGDFEAYSYSSTVDPQLHIALVHGGSQPVRLRWCASIPSA